MFLCWLLSSVEKPEEMCGLLRNQWESNTFGSLKISLKGMLEKVSMTDLLFRVSVARVNSSRQNSLVGQIFPTSSCSEVTSSICKRPRSGACSQEVFEGYDSWGVIAEKLLHSSHGERHPGLVASKLFSQGKEFPSQSYWEAQETSPSEGEDYWGEGLLSQLNKQGFSMRINSPLNTWMSADLLPHLSSAWKLDLKRLPFSWECWFSVIWALQMLIIFIQESEVWGGGGTWPLCYEHSGLSFHSRMSSPLWMLSPVDQSFSHKKASLNDWF